MGCSPSFTNSWRRFHVWFHIHLSCTRSQARRLDSYRAPPLWVYTDAEAPRAICTHDPVRLWMAQSGRLLETYQSNHSSTLAMQLLCNRLPKRFLPLAAPRAGAISDNVAHPLRQPRYI